MAPEQGAPGEIGELGPWSDVWGLGATLYHAIAGQTPFRRGSSGDGEASLDERFPQLTEPVRPWPARVPEELGHAMLACLRRDAAERPTAAELASAMQPLVAALPEKLVLGRQGKR